MHGVITDYEAGGRKVSGASEQVALEVMGVKHCFPRRTSVPGSFTAEPVSGRCGNGGCHNVQRQKESFYGSPPNFSSMKSSVLEPPHGGIS